MIYCNNMKYLFFFLALALLASPFLASAGPVNLNLEYPPFPGAPDLKTEQSLPNVVAWVYYTIVGISGFAAFVMMAWGGVQWLSSAGNPASIGDATDRIQNALLGLLVVLGSYILLQLINPDFLNLNLPVF